MCVFSKRLSANIYAWNNINVPIVVKNWLCDGVRLPFVDDYKPQRFWLHNKSFSCTERQFLNSEIRDLEIQGAIERVSYRPHCVSPIKCVAKKGGKLRLVTDLRCVNDSIDSPTFQCEGINSVSQLLSKGDYMCKTDLKNGFFHIPVHPEHRKFLGFQYNNVYYVWNVLPFGLSCSPYYFNKCLRPVVTFLRQQGIKVVLYVDDCLIIAPYALITDHRDFVLQTFEELGFIINYAKSVLEPSTSLEFIGHLLDSLGPGDQPWIYATASKLTQIKKVIKRAIKQGYVQAKLLAKITGHAIYVSKAILPGKIKLRSLYALLRTKITWSDFLTIDNDSLRDLKWWLEAIEGWNGSPLRTAPVQVQIWTDSSDYGWGAVCEGIQASGTWNPITASKHINFKELTAVQLALESFGHQIAGKSIQVLTDNSTTVAYLNNMGGPVMQLTEVAESIWANVLAQECHLQARHVPGVQNTQADHLSRLPLHYEWQLNPLVFNRIDNIWGPHSIDRFASVTTTQLQTYNSRFADPQTHGIDALAQQDWRLHNNYVNPPFRLIPRVLDVVQAQQAEATLIAPYWPSQPWFGKLQSMLVAPPFQLPRGPNVVIPLGDIAEPLRNRKWQMYAYRISGDPSYKD